MNNPACLNEEKRVFTSVCRVSSEGVWYSDIMCYNMLIVIEDENVFSGECCSRFSKHIRPKQSSVVECAKV